MLRKIIFVLLCLASQWSLAQKINGSWYGKADVAMEGTHNNYLTELVLKQKGGRLEGVFAYYFKDSYQSFYIHGTYDKQTREVNIKNIPLIYYLATDHNGIECPMNFKGTLMISKVNASLKGFFYSDNKYKYTCPELRVSMILDVDAEKDTLPASTVTVVGKKKLWKPREEDVVVTRDVADSKSTTVATDTTAANRLAIDTKRVAPARLNENIEKKLLQEFEKRKSVYGRDLEIEGDSVRLSFYDNGEIDGDSISVFLNKSPILVSQQISARALNIYLALDSTKEVNEISMFANNLGRIPPNTALMVVTDGKNRYEVFLSSSFTQNATVRLRKKK